MTFTDEDYASFSAAETEDRANGLAGYMPEPDLLSLTSLWSQRAWPEPLRPEAFHGLAGEFVRIVEPHSESDPAALLLTFLAGVGNAIGDGPSAHIEADKHPARLFVVIVGDTSSGRKGISGSRVRQLLEFAFAGYKDRFINGLGSGEGLIHFLRDPDQPDDAEDSDEIPDRRALLFEGEFGQVLRVASRSGSTLTAVFRNGWDSGDLRVLTKNNPIKATDTHISMVAHITTEELTAELTASDTANGFANRLLWICSRRSKLLPDGGDLDFKELLPICAELEQIAKWAAKPRHLRRDDPARELWHQVYPELSAGHPGAFGKATSRAEAQVLRLSVLYAALDSSEAIRAEHLRAALAVWKYAEDSAKVIFGQSVGDQDADRILRAVRQRPEGLTRTEIRDLFDRHRTTEQIAHSLELISDHVEIVKTATGGRPVERVARRDESDVSDKRSAS